MVNAQLEDRKTQTRRLLEDAIGDLDRPFMMDDGSWHITDSRGGHMSPLKVRHRKGDRLWVREAWRTEPKHDGLKPTEIPVGAPLLTMADTGVEFPSPLWGRYRSGRYMMRWMSRLTWRVTEVRVQRLQDISEADARAEGIIEYEPAEFAAVEGGAIYNNAVSAYRDLWGRINGPENWAANPWVVATTAIVEQRNIDR